MDATPSLLALSITLPPPSTDGNLTCTLSPLTAPAGLSPTDLAVALDVHAFRPNPLITAIDPRSLSSGVSTSVRVDMQSLGVGWELGALAISIGGAPVPASKLLFADLAGAAFLLDTPTSLPVGKALLTVALFGLQAERELTVAPAGLKAECVEGCRVAFSGGGSTQVLLTGFGNNLAVRDLAAVVDGEPAVVRALDGDLCSLSLPAFARGDAIAPVDALLHISLVANPATFTLAEVTYVPAPKFIWAEFSADGGGITMQCSQQTAAEGQGSCDKWVAVEADGGSLGAAPLCAWEGGSRLKVVLGQGAEIMPGEKLVFIGEGVRAVDGASDAMVPHTVIVTAPKVVSVPKLVVSGPAELGSCDAASLFVSGGSARALVFTWGCDSSQRVNDLLVGVTTSEAVVPGTALEVDEPTVVWVVATTFLGGRSPRLEHQASRHSQPSPL